MKYKLIASDFDGTLANSNDEITPRTVSAVKAYNKAGGIFAISTGRMLESVYKRLPEFEFSYSVPIISFQGALITDSLSKKVIFKADMDKQLLSELAAFAKERNVYCHIYSYDNIYVEKDCDILQKYCAYSRIEGVANFVGDLSKFIKNTSFELIKIIFIDSEEKIDELCSEVNEKFKGRAVFTKSAKQFIECVDARAGKGNALMFLADYLKIDRAATAAIGDSMNDLSMIEAAGLGIAVGNADEKLKSAADMVTVTNNEDAVAQTLEKAINGQL